LRELEGVVLRSVVLRGRGIVGPGDLEFSIGVRGSGVERGGEGEKRGRGDTETRGHGDMAEGGDKGSVFDAMVWTLAHEIKNPLVAIRTYASLLPEKYGDEEFRGEFSRLVSMDVKRVNEVLENLLEYAQFGEPRVGRQDLKGLVDGLLGQKEKGLGERGVQLEVEMGTGLPGVSFDGEQLGYVLRNVLGNACLRVREGSKMRLWAGLVEGEGKGFVELGVWYEGQNGVMRQVRGERVGEGAELENWSLALALARKVMLRNRGEMRVSLEEGLGTTVRLRFPVANGDEK
jgi:polar amino acid transport system substrate-binding protein